MSKIKSTFYAWTKFLLETYFNRQISRILQIWSWKLDIYQKLRMPLCYPKHFVYTIWVPVVPKWNNPKNSTWSTYCRWLIDSISMRDVAAEQLEPLNRTQRLFAGVLLLLLVDVIWVVSMYGTVTDDYWFWFFGKVS